MPAHLEGFTPKKLNQFRHRLPVCSGDESLDPHKTNCSRRCTYELVAADDVCHLPGEPKLGPAAAAWSTLDFANATAFVAGHENARAAVAHLTGGPFRSPCRGSASPQQGISRTLLLALAPAFHGSTALLNFIMSNPGVSTLCSGLSWECEGAKFLRVSKKTASLMSELGLASKPWGVLDNNGREHSESFYKMISLIKETRNNRSLRAGTEQLKPNASLAANTPWCTPKLAKTLTKMVGEGADSPSTVALTAIIWEAVATWSRIWDLRAPVLLEKTPSWISDVPLLHDALVTYSGPWPLRAVRPVYAIMWKPLCLASLSSHFRHNVGVANGSSLLCARGDKKVGGSKEICEAILNDDKRLCDWEAVEGSGMCTGRICSPLTELQKEVDKLEETVHIVTWAKRVGARTIIISYADLLWKPNVVSKQLEKLLPCIASNGFDSKWRPKLGKDIFKKNTFKVDGSVYSYGQLHPPRSMCYDVKTNRCMTGILSCTGQKSSFGGATLQSKPYTDLLARYEAHSNFLLEHTEINL